MYVANLIEQERVFAIISGLRSHPSGPSVLAKSRANRIREATAEFNFKSTLSKSVGLLARQSKCVFVLKYWSRMGNSLCPGCVGGGIYVNISVAGECDSSRWTQSPHTDIVKNHRLPHAACKNSAKQNAVVKGVTVITARLFYSLPVDVAFLHC